MFNKCTSVGSEVLRMRVFISRAHGLATLFGTWFSWKVCYIDACLISNQLRIYFALNFVQILFVPYGYIMLLDYSKFSILIKGRFKRATCPWWLISWRIMKGLDTGLNYSLTDGDWSWWRWKLWMKYNKNVNFIS